jgi:hypothetical protein
MNIVKRIFMQCPPPMPWIRAIAYVLKTVRAHASVTAQWARDDLMSKLKSFAQKKYITNCLGRVLIVALLGMTAGCAVKVVKSVKLEVLAEKPQKLTFIWSGSDKTFFSPLPALSVAIIGTRFEVYFKNYPAEYLAFSEAISASLSAQPILKTPDIVELPLALSEAGLIARIQQVPAESAIVVMYPERVTAYCTPGCYSFNVRVSYLAPGDHRKIWTALLDVPPKNKHSDPFEARAVDFANVLAEKLKAENLTP